MEGDDTRLSDIHFACYVGNTDAVRKLLAEGIDPNNHHDPENSTMQWISGPTPLNKVCIALDLTWNHIEVAKLLIENGAKIHPSCHSDLAAEMLMDEIWLTLQNIIQKADSNK
tara:strand:- start:90 stop:428 length:339 start_codon:yes stop_codon:yes gene_type:complete